MYFCCTNNKSSIFKYSYIILNYFILFLISMLTACGGGDGARIISGGSVAIINDTKITDTVEKEAVSLNFTKESLSVTYENPKQTNSTIASIASGYEVVEANAKSIQIPAGTLNNETLVVATNSSGVVLLASYVINGQSVNLSPASTALAMARIALTPLPANLTPNQINPDILGSIEFANLTNLINKSLIKGTPPAESSEVLSSLSILVPQVINKIKLKQLNSGVMVGIVSKPTQLPYDLVSKDVSIGDKNGEDINLYNKTYVGWSVSTSDMDGKVITASKILPGFGVFDGLTSFFLSGDLLTPFPLKGNDSAFLVNAVIDNNSLIYAGSMTAVNIANAILTPILPLGKKIDQSCVGSFVVNAISSDLAVLFADRSAASLISYLSKYVTSQEVVVKFIECSGINKAAVSVFLNYYNPVSQFISAVKFSISAAEVVLPIIDIFRFPWNEIYSAEICKNNGIFAPCSIVINSSSSVMVEKTLQLTAIDQSKKPIKNSNLTWSMDSNEFATLNSTGQITGVKPGVVLVKVSDPYNHIATSSITVGDVETYQGSYVSTDPDWILLGGGDSGVFTVLVDSNGSVTGTGTSNLRGKFQISGSVNGAGSILFNASGNTFTAPDGVSHLLQPTQLKGSIDSNGNLTGFWVQSTTVTFTERGSSTPNTLTIYDEGSFSGKKIPKDK